MPHFAGLQPLLVSGHEFYSCRPTFKIIRASAAGTWRGCPLKELMNPKQESESLLNSLFPVAEMLLKKYGEFYPYGGYMDPDGEIRHVGAKDADTDYPMSKDLIDLLTNMFCEMVTYQTVQGRSLGL